MIKSRMSPVGKGEMLNKNLLLKVAFAFLIYPQFSLCDWYDRKGSIEKGGYKNSEPLNLCQLPPSHQLSGLKQKLVYFIKSKFRRVGSLSIQTKMLMAKEDLPIQ